MSFIIEFLSKHKRKFFYSGALTISVILVNKYATKMILDWHQNHSQNLISKQKRKQHYEKLRQTAISTVLGLSGSITKIVNESLETDTVIQAIKSSTGNNQELWEQLKVLSFSRCVSSAYVAALLSAIVHVKIMVLGGYSFSGVTGNDVVNNKLTEDLQERYLLGIYNILEFGLPQLTKAIHNNVRNSLSDLKLDRKLSLKQLETVLSDLCLFGADENLDVDYVVKSKHLCFQNLIDEASSWPHSSKKQTLLQMLEETKEVIYTEDFKSLVLILVQNCLNHILDELADRFIVPVNKDAMDSTGMQINDQLIGNLPVAKVLPLLSGLVTTTLSATPGQLFSKVMINSHLEAFSFNVYESFSRVS